MNNSVFGETMENGSMEILSQLVSQPNNRTIKYFSENLLATKVKKNESKNEQASVSRIINTVNQ